jgi:hypothetical protein
MNRLNARWLMTLLPIVLAFGAASVWVAPISAAESDPSDIFWVDAFSRGGSDGEIQALAQYKGDVYAGGYFRWMNETRVSSLARWHGGEWRDLGIEGYSIVGMVNWNNLLVAGGGFLTRCRGGWTRNIACWNGSEWLPLGHGLEGRVSAIGMFRGDVVVAEIPPFPAPYGPLILRWTGATWDTLARLVDSDVRILCEYHETLVAAGSFASIDSVRAEGIAQWDGSRWTSLAGGPIRSVFALAAYKGELVAGGSPSANLPKAYLAAWNGSAWRVLVAEDSNGDGTQAIVVDGDLLLSAHQRRDQSGGDSIGIDVWDGTTPRPRASRFNGRMEALLPTAGGLIAGGYFSSVDGRSMTCIAGWNGSVWSALGQNRLGMDGPVNAFVEWQGSVVAGGAFQWGGDVNTRYVARWAGNSWAPLGDGPGGPVKALATYNGDLIAATGPTFTSSGWTHGGVVGWDGTTWNPLTQPADGSMEVDCFATLDNELIAGGAIATLGGVSVHNIARWNGARWDSLGSGFDGVVEALVTYQGSLYAGGAFTHAGRDSVPGLARWDGDRWVAIPGAPGDIREMVVYQGDLVTGPEPLRWNGSAWSRLGSVELWGVLAFGLYRNELVVSGFRLDDFRWVGLSTWNGSRWSSFGSGSDLYSGHVGAMLEQGGALWVGGYFESIGGRRSSNVARWLEDPALVIPDRPLALTRTAPNPFVTETFVAFATPAGGAVRLAVYDLSGREVALLINQKLGSGRHEVRWGGLSRAGEPVLPGIYFLRLDAPAGSGVQKLVRLK